jgi:hypothetical protein
MYKGSRCGVTAGTPDASDSRYNEYRDALKPPAGQQNHPPGHSVTKSQGGFHASVGIRATNGPYSGRRAGTFGEAFQPLRLFAAPGRAGKTAEAF